MRRYVDDTRGEEYIEKAHRVLSTKPGTTLSKY